MNEGDGDSYRTLRHQTRLFAIINRLLREGIRIAVNDRPVVDGQTKKKMADIDDCGKVMTQTAPGKTL